MYLMIKNYFFEYLPSKLNALYKIKQKLQKKYKIHIILLLKATLGRGSIHSI